MKCYDGATTAANIDRIRRENGSQSPEFAAACRVHWQNEVQRSWLADFTANHPFVPLTSWGH